MAPVKLPKTDVVVIGLGAAGGLAVLPLARAGLKTVGLEAGGWFRPEDHLPDEICSPVLQPRSPVPLFQFLLSD